MRSFIEELLRMTMWPMTKPPAYGAFHISFTLIGFALCYFAAWKLRKLGEKGSRALLFGCGAFLLITELYKQLLYYYCLGDAGYDWDILPFQLCSIPMYLCLAAPLLKKGRVQKSLYSFMAYFNLLGGAISFAEPSGLLHSWWTLTFPSLLWHMCLVFIGLFLFGTGREENYGLFRCRKSFSSFMRRGIYYQHLAAGAERWRGEYVFHRAEQ